MSNTKVPESLMSPDVCEKLLPPGMVAPFATASAPSGWLVCDGSAVSRTTYANLFAATGTIYGSGDGTTTFNLPDYRGQFLRGVDGGTGVDPDAASRTDRGDGTTGDAVGTKQADDFRSHDHQIQGQQKSNPNASGIGGLYPLDSSPVSGAFVTDTGGNETRPVNVSVLYCVKY